MLALACRLLERLGETSEALRDLSISLNKVGGAHQAVSQWDPARAAFDEGRDIARRLCERLPRIGDHCRLLEHLETRLWELDGTQQQNPSVKKATE